VRLKFAHMVDGGSFTGSGIHVSADGVNFVQVKVLDTFVAMQDFTEYSLDLDKLATDLGLQLNEHFVIRFEFDG